MRRRLSKRLLRTCLRPSKVGCVGIRPSPPTYRLRLLDQAKDSETPSHRFVEWGDEGTPTQSTFEDHKQVLKAYSKP